MSKPKPAVSLFKNPPVAPPQADQFVERSAVAGAEPGAPLAEAPASRAPRSVSASAPASLPVGLPGSPPPPARKRGITTRQDGREMARTSLYLPVELARQLAMAAAMSDSDQTSIITAALQAYLPSILGPGRT